jgi:hypothetical protein
MNADPMSGENAREPWEVWSGLDDTLADGGVGAPAEVPAAELSPAELPAAARAWLADQRFVHGLLRAMQQSDAEAREARVAAILAAARPPGARRSWLVAAAALLLCAVAGMFWLPGRLPSAEAAVQRAAELLGQDVDRRFTMTFATVDTDGRERNRNELDFTTRPGMRVLLSGSVQFGPFHLDDMRAGCDGTEVWWRFGPDGKFKQAQPLQSDRLLSMFGNVLDLGYLDVHALVENLPSTFELRTVGRERDAAGRSVLHIQAVGEPRRPGVKLKRADLLVDEATGMITRVEVEFAGPRGRGHFGFEYLGVVQLDPAAYRRPW